MVYATACPNLVRPSGNFSYTTSLPLKWLQSSLERVSPSPKLPGGIVMHLQELLFLGLNGRVAALDRDSGEIVWEWTAKDPDKDRAVGGYMTLLVDQGQLF